MNTILETNHRLNQNSYYEASVTRSFYPPLEGREDADVAIVGGGFAGLSSAIELAKRGYKVVLLEAGLICSGASGRNGGQTIVGYACDQQVFVEQLGMTAARTLWDMSLEAIALVDERIKTYGIDCDRVHGYLNVATSRRKARSLINQAQELEKRYGFSSQIKEGHAVREHIDSQRYYASSYETTSGHLHPLKYGLGLATVARKLGASIHEKSTVTRLDHGPRVTLYTEKGEVRADFAVLAGNAALAAYSPRLADGISRRIMPVGTYMVATSPLSEALAGRLIPSRAAVCDNNFVLDYFRVSADNRLLFGGGVSYTAATPLFLKERMHARMERIFPALRDTPVEFVWGGFVDISMNRAPDFGRFGTGRNVYYVHGFGGHGVALTGLAGVLVAESIASQSSRFDLFATLKHRLFFGGEYLRAPTLALGMLYYRLKDKL